MYTRIYGRYAMTVRNSNKTLVILAGGGESLGQLATVSSSTAYLEVGYNLGSLERTSLLGIRLSTLLVSL